MSEQRILEWAIEDIIPAHPNLYLEHCAVMAVTLMSQYVVSPCEFIVECKGFQIPELGTTAGFRLRVAWAEQTALKSQRIWQTEQPKSIVERAAVALAALLIAKLVPDGQMQVTRVGDKADYWLPHLQYALEVSGTERPGELARRHREKVMQMLDNPLGWNGYVIVCCFSPRRRRIRWSYEQQEEGNEPSP